MRRSMMFGLWLVVCAVQAEQILAERELTLEQVVVRVLENNPELKSASLASQAMAVRIREARLTPAMSVNIELENFAGSGNYQGSESLESTLSLSKVFELGNKSELRADVTQHAALLFNGEQDVKRLDILAQAARQFVQIVVDQSRVTIAQDKLQLLQNSYQVVDRRVKAGRSHVAERRRMAIAVARAEIELQHAEHELQTSRVKLATYWGAISPDFTSAHAELFDLKQLKPFAQLQAQLDQNPDLIRFASQQRLAEARVHLAEAKQSADIELTGGIRHFNSVDDTAFVLAAHIPFGLTTRARPGIDEQSLRARQVPFDYEKQKLLLYSSLYAIYQELEHSYAATQVFQQRILPQAQQALREYEQGYSAGRFSFLELSDAQQTLLQARLDAVTTAANYHRYQIEIDRLTGAGLSTGAQP